MITTEQLREWQKIIEDKKWQAQQQARAYANDTGMRQYYINLIQVAEAQHSMVRRMIAQSEENEVAEK